MISDVLHDAVAQVNQYLADKTFEKVYAGDIRERIIKLVAAMDGMRRELDAVPPACGSGGNHNAPYCPEHLRIVECYGRETRYLAIARVYEMLDGRDPENVSLDDAVTAIRSRMPDADAEEIAAALAWDAERKERYSGA
jgi:hypothetical protein